MDTDFKTATSADGTKIAYVTAGQGPTVVLVGGAFCDRNFSGELFGLLSEAFTVVGYDRRGRGDSGDTRPYQVQREIEDLAAVIEASGGVADLYGVSSGAILAFEATAAGLPVRRLVMMEPPYTVDDSREPMPSLADDYQRLCEAGRPGDAVELFMTKAVGQPQEMADQMRATPMWPGLEAMAPTLEYDARIVGDANIPDRAASLRVPVLMIDSESSPKWLRSSAERFAEAVPDGRHVSLPGQFHQPDATAVVEQLRGFLA